MTLAALPKAATTPAEKKSSQAEIGTFAYGSWKFSFALPLLPEHLPCSKRGPPSWQFPSESQYIKEQGSLTKGGASRVKESKDISQMVSLLEQARFVMNLAAKDLDRD